MQSIGERRGTGRTPLLDMAVGPAGTLPHARDISMEKIAVGPPCRGTVDIHKSVAENLRSVAQAPSKDISCILVAVVHRA